LLFKVLLVLLPIGAPVDFSSAEVVHWVEGGMMGGLISFSFPSAPAERVVRTTELYAAAAAAVGCI